MAISDKTRKMLWGKSGNRCSICREVLTREKTEYDDHCVLGEECHIISKSIVGPRHIPDLGYDYDGYENLVLLCGTHHTEVDNQPIKYNAIYLVLLKKEHEEWVEKTLKRAAEAPERKLTPEEEYEETKDQTELLLLRQIKTGKEEMEIALNSMAFHTDYDETAPDEDVEIIGDFFQNFRDWSDILNDIEISERIKATVSMNQELKELEKRGYLVFGKVHDEKYRAGKNKFTTMQVAIMFVLKKDNQKIMSNADGSEKGMFAIAKKWILGFTM